MLTQPTKITVAFGTNGLRNSIPVTKGSAAATNLADYTSGFPQITMTAKTAGGLPPFGRDINGVLYEITDAIRYAQSGANFEFDGDFAASIGGYEKGAVVLRSDGGGLLLSAADSNTTNPDNDNGAKWQPVNSGVTKINVSNTNLTLNVNQAAAPILIIQGALTANVTITLPLFLRSWVVLNNATGNYSVTMKTAAGSGVAVKNTSKSVIFCDGLNILSLSNEAEKTPPGTCVMFAGANVPDGWLLCDGRAVSRLLYPELFAAIGTAWGEGDGSTTFNLPNRIDRFDRGGRTDKLATYAQGSIQAHTHGVTQTAHTHGVTQTAHTHGASQTAHTHGASQTAHTHGVTQTAHTHGVTDNGHTHTLSQTAHSHGVTDNGHSHGITDSGHTHQYGRPLGGYAAGGAAGALVSGSHLTTSSEKTGVTVNSGRTGVSVNGATISISAASSRAGVTVNSANANISVNSAQPAVTVSSSQPAVTVNSANANISVNGATANVTVNSAGGAETAPAHVYMLPIIKY